MSAGLSLVRARVELAVPASALVAAASTSVAGVAHLAVVPEHLAEARWVGLAFVVVAILQLASVTVLVRPVPWVDFAVVVLTVGLVTAYGLTRTVPLPLVHAGHEVGQSAAPGAIGDGMPVLDGPEPVTWIGVLCVVAELVLVATLVGRSTGRWRVASVASCVGSALLGAVVAVVIAIG